MSITENQSRIDISGTNFPHFTDPKGNNPERFWFIKDQFINHSQNLLKHGNKYNCIDARLEGGRWVSNKRQATKADIAVFILEMRLFYMKTEYVSVYSFCSYMEKQVKNQYVVNFFRHMRENWENYLSWEVIFPDGDYNGPVKTNKHLIDTLLYSNFFHTQKKYKERFDGLLELMDENLILMTAFNAMHCGYQMNQISRAVSSLQDDTPIILLPDHLRHHWDIE